MIFKYLTPNSIFKKTFYIIVFNLLIIIFSFLYYLLNNQKLTLLNNLHSEASVIANTTILSNSDAIIEEDYAIVVNRLQKILQNNFAIEYILFNNEQIEPIISKNRFWEVMPQTPKMIDDMETDTITGRILATELHSNEVYHLVYPIEFSGVDWGWIHIGLSLQTYKKDIESFINSSIIVVGFMFILSLAFSYFITKMILNPILLLHNAIKEVKRGNYDVSIEKEVNDEIGELICSFKAMMDEVKSSNYQLKMMNEELENRVKNRTKELKILNEELDKKVKDEIQKRRQHEQILIHQSRFAAMGEMIGNIAHQWRQPLNALGLLIQNLELAYDLKMIDSSYIDRTVEKSRSLILGMSTTIDDFRNFFRNDKEVELFYIHEVLCSVVEIVRSSFEHHQIEIITDVDKELRLYGYSRELAQAILNILGNAKDALVENIEEDRKVYIKAYQKNEKMYIEFGDNAGGIEYGILAKVFDPYFTTKDQGQGTGIGLYMAKTIIESHMNGSLNVSNKNNGAFFEIIFDLTQEVK